MKKSKNMHIVLSNKTHQCKCCGSDKPLDEFVNKVNIYTGRGREYECIDCKVNRIYHQFIPGGDGSINNSPERKKSILKKWITAKV